MGRFGLSILGLLIAVAQQANATTYYVSITGNDSNNGTHPSTAWRTLRPAVNVEFAAGDSLLLYGGETFTGRLYFDDKDANNPNDPFVVSTYGTSERATILAEDGYGIYVYNTQGIRIENLVIRGSGMSTNTKAGVEFFLDEANDRKFRNVVLKNLEVSNFGQAGVRVGAWQGNTGFEQVLLEDLDVHDNLADGIQVYGFFSQTGYPHKNIVIRRCKSYNNPGFADQERIRGNGIVVSNADGVLVEYCLAYGNGAANVHCGGPGGIWAYDANAVTIQFCESHSNATNSRCDGLGFDLDGGTTNSVIQYCYSHDNAGGGFLLGQYDGARPWFNNTCRYNISVNDGRTNASSITVFKGGTTTSIRDVYVYNNTVYVTPSAFNPALAGFGITEWNTGIENVHVYNNVFVALGDVRHVHVPPGYEARFAGNIYWSSTSDVAISYNNKVYKDLVSFRRETGNEQIDGRPTGRIGDPLLSALGFSSPLWPASPESMSSYMITSAKSRAFNGGVDVRELLPSVNVTRDLAGTLVPMYGRFDVGAIEYTGDTVGSWLGDTTGNGSDTNDTGSGTSVLDASGRVVDGVFPNPAPQQFTVVSGVLAAAQYVEVSSLLGTKVLVVAATPGRVIVDGTHLPGGLYIVRILSHMSEVLREYPVVVVR